MSLISSPPTITSFIPNSKLLTFVDLLNTFLINTNTSPPQLIGKWRIDFPSGNNGIIPLIVWASEICNVQTIFNAHSGTIFFDVSQDDITYGGIYNTSFSFNANGSVSDLRENLSLSAITNNKLFIRISASISNPGVESVNISKMQFQMMLLYAAGATITKIG